MRTFIAIDIPESIKKEIIKIQKQLPKFAGKKTEAESLHLTLKFLGEVDEKKIEKIRKMLREIKLNSFEIQIQKIGMFSDRIVWLGIKNCNELQKIIDNQLSRLFEMENRFMGHLTIARIKNLEGRKQFLEELRKIKLPEMKFIVKKFNLKESKPVKRGHIYRDIETYKLGI